MQKHRLALIGFGGMGSWHAKNAMEKVPEVEVVGAYDIRPEALEKAKEMGLRAYVSLEALRVIDLLFKANAEGHSQKCHI